MCIVCTGIVYKSNCTKPVDHAVDLVGVGVQTVLSVTTNITCKTEQIPYYIVKNRLESLTCTGL